MFKKGIAVFVFLFFSAMVDADDWAYEKYNKWPGSCNSGKKQSPIALYTKSATVEKYEPFQFINYNKTIAVNLTNNGHSVNVVFLAEPPTLKGGGLHGEYKLVAWHFHWPSEHTIDGKQYPLEMHMVHYSTKYPNLAEATKAGDGVAVLGALYYTSPDDDYVFRDTIKGIVQKVEKYGTKADANVAPDIFLPRDRAGFFRYQGSLTVPQCDEELTWTVFTNLLPISQEQLDAINIEDHDGNKLKINNRPIQPYNSRTVYIKKSNCSNLQSEISLLYGIFLVFLLHKFYFACI